MALSFLKVLEIADVEFFAGQLFRSRFGNPPPTYGRHFVCLYNAAPQVLRVAAYVHYSHCEAFYLAGGLVVDERLYRLMPREHLKSLAAVGSFAEISMRESIRVLEVEGAAAIFATIGDAKSRTINERVGFVSTPVAHLFVRWSVPVAPDGQRAILDRISRLMPF